MQLLGFCTLLLLISTSYGADNVTTVATGIVTNPFTRSVIIDVPSGCQYSGKTATLNISGPTSKTFTFTVPQCRLKRGLIVVNDSQSGNVETVNVGYQVQDLMPNANYTAQYVIGGDTLTTAQFTTQNGESDLPPVTFARSGGMVVITVILSVAMFLLLGGLIAVLVLGGAGKK